MPTSIVSLDETQYVQVNSAGVRIKPVVLQSLRDEVRIALNDTQPAKDTTNHHTLSGSDAPLQLEMPDVNIWALAMTDRSALIVSELDTVVEPYSGAIRTIEQEHASIHDGNGYQLSGEIVALANGTSTYFLVDPSTPIHWRDYTFQADNAPLDVEFFENPTVTDNGSTLTPLNRNRLSSNVSSAAVYSGPTVTVDGTQLYLTRVVGTGPGANKTGELDGPPVEWIIDGGNTYLMKITNNSGGAVNLVYSFFWYEL